MKGGEIVLLGVVLGLFLSVGVSYAAEELLDSPHYSINSVGCENCHFPHNVTEKYLADYLGGSPTTIDDTLPNNLCWSCHNEVIAPLVRTHSSLQIDNDYGNWSMECRRCHWPHQQMQPRTHGSESYVYSNVSTGVSSANLSQSDANWSVDEFADMILYPNTSVLGLNYKIVNNTVDTLVVEGSIDLSQVSAGETFAIVYGQLVKAVLPTPNSGDKTVKLFRDSGNNSFADNDTVFDGPCEVCHTKTSYHRNNASGDHLHNTRVRCTNCHQHLLGFSPMGGGAHTTHVTEEYGPKISCSSDDTGCHGSNSPPVLRDGGNLSNTTVCNECHSANGVATAKQYWNEDPGSSIGVAGTWAVNESYSSFCGSCHDATPGKADPDFDSSGDASPNVIGDNSTYGFFKTGHGKESGNYSRLSWQETSADGNPAANKTCSDCHELTSTHFNNTDNRLKSGFENDANNSVCQQCHDPGTVAVGSPEWYTTYTAFENSAHFRKEGGKGTNKCTTCHDVHGATGAYTAMVKGNVKVTSPTDSSNFCYTCHSDSGGVSNIALSGTVYNNDIKEAFSESYAHTLGHTFTLSAASDVGTYSLQCQSCHNVHIVSGAHWDLNEMNVSPVSRFFNNTEVWGDEPSEKMDYYATYGDADRNPSGLQYPGIYQIPGAVPNYFNGSALVNYPSFCMDCHQYDINRAAGERPWDATAYGDGSVANPAYNVILGKEWGDALSKDKYGVVNQYGGGNPHGLKMAGQTSLGVWPCPDVEWKCSYMYSTIFPRVPRGGGSVSLMKGAYTQDVRKAGWNYVLSCTDCHDPHGGNKYSLLRNSLNRDVWHPDDQLYLEPNKVNKFVGGGTQGFCYQCHAIDTREHRIWHHQPNYCSPCNGFDGHPQHMLMGAVPVGSDHACHGLCHSRIYSKAPYNSYHVKATFHENRRGAYSPNPDPAYDIDQVWDTNRSDDNIAFFPHEVRNGNPVLYWFSTLVTDMKFQGNFINDAPWNLHGSWVSEAPGTGTFTTGYDGSPNSAIDIDGKGVQLGATDGIWDGNINPVNIPHEMKYAGTWEAWLYPKSYPPMDPDEPGCWGWTTPDRYIMTSETSGVNQMFLLAYQNDEFGASYRAQLYVSVKDNVTSSREWRGAYSNVSIPLNQWTHVAATYNASLYGEDRNASNKGQGRIRIYVNGQDVTWNNPSASNSNDYQPGDVEGEGEYGSVGGDGLQTCTDIGCDRRFVIGGHTYWPNCRHIIGKIDNVKVWNIDKGTDYFGKLIPPSITLVESLSGVDQLYVNFSTGVYASSGGVGDLQITDFAFTDTDNGRTITSVAHTAGDNYAVLNLSGAFDTLDDVGIDTLAPVGGSIFNANGVPALVQFMIVTTISPTARVIAASGSIESSWVSVLFDDYVYANKDMTGALQATDFVVQSTDNVSRTILSVNHTEGAPTALLNLSSPLNNSANASLYALVRAQNNSVFNEVGNPSPINFNTVLQRDIPYLRDVKGQVGYNVLYARFSETVYAEQSGAGTLGPEDFVLSDDDGRTITAVNHTPGIELNIIKPWDDVHLTLSSPLNESDFSEIVSLAPNGIYDSINNLVNETPVNITKLSGAEITRVEGSLGSSVLKVIFSHWVYGDVDATGDLEVSDFILTDINGDNPRTISLVEHTAANTYALINMSAPLAYADLDTDVISVASFSSVYDDENRPVIPNNVTITGSGGPRMTASELMTSNNLARTWDVAMYLRFSEGVWGDRDRNGSLQLSDFIYTDAFDSRTLTSILHTPGSDWVQLIVSDDWNGPVDRGVHTIAAVPNSIFDYMGRPMGSESRVLYEDNNWYAIDAEAVVGSPKIKVTLEEPAIAARWSGGLQTNAFRYYDWTGDGARTELSVEHNEWDEVAILTMNTSTTAEDMHMDYIKFGTDNSFNPAGRNFNEGRAVIINPQLAPVMTGVTGETGSDKVLVTFSEGVYTSKGESGALTTSDFAYDEFDQNTYNLVANDSECGTDWNASTSTYIAAFNDSDGGGLTTSQSTCTNRTRIVANSNDVLTTRGFASFISEPYTSNMITWASNVTVTANLSNTTTNYTVYANLFNVVCSEATTNFTLIDNASLMTLGHGNITDYILSFAGLSETIGPGNCSQVTIAIDFIDETSVYPQHNGTDMDPDEFYNSSVVIMTQPGTSRSITAVEHIAGEDTAILTLSSALTGAGDIGLDTIEVASSAIYNNMDNAVDTTPVTILGTTPDILAVEGAMTSTWLKVSFSERVYASAGKTGALQPADFTLTDTNADNARTINAVSHTAGDRVAWVNMSARLITADEEIDTLAAAVSSIYNAINLTSSTTPVAITARNGPYIRRVEGTVGLDQILVAFNEGVWTSPGSSGKINPGQSGRLRKSDFDFIDNDNGRTIQQIDHEPGSATALLTLSSALDSSNDISVDMISAKSKEIWSATAIPADTTPVTMDGWNCPLAGFRVDFNEPANSSYVYDDTGLLNFTVGNSTHSMRGDGIYYGDPNESVNVWLQNNNNKRCLRNERSFTVETRIFAADVDFDYLDVQPQNGIDDDVDAGMLQDPINVNYKLPGGRTCTSSYLMERGQFSGWFVSISRCNFMSRYYAEYKDTAGFGTKFWINEKAWYNGTGPYQSDYFINTLNDGIAQVGTRDDRAISSYHWYVIRQVINMDKGAQVVSIFIDDQGTDGNNTNELWTGYSLVNRPEVYDAGGKFQAWPGQDMRMWPDYIALAGPGTMGPPPPDPPLLPDDTQGNVQLKGKMDWIRWSPLPDYKGVDDPPAN